MKWVESMSHKGRPITRTHFTIKAKGWETRWWNDVGRVIETHFLDDEVMPILTVCQTSAKYELALKSLMFKAYEQGMIRGAQARKRWDSERGGTGRCAKTGL